MSDGAEMLEFGRQEKAPAPRAAPSPVRTAVKVFALAVVCALIGSFSNLLFNGGVLADAKVSQLPHLVLAIVLGLVLVLRLGFAMQQFAAAKAALCSFYAAAATIAVTASHVSEALTISAGAEHEKKGMYMFRSELARLLGFAVRCANVAIKDEPLLKDPHLMTVEDMLVIGGPHRPTPALFAVKLVSKLIAMQREAGRFDSALCAQANASIGQMVGAYTSLMSAKKLPLPPSVSELASAWTYGFCFTLPVAVASLTSATAWSAPCAALLISAFFFALNEVAAQLEDLPSLFAHDVGLREAERQLMLDLHIFASERANGAAGML